MKNFTRATESSPRKFLKHFTAAFAFLLLVCVGTGFSRSETAAVVGTVTDSTGGVVLGAMVTIRNLGTGVSRTAATTGGCDYVI